MFGLGGSGEGVVSMTEREKERRLAPLRLIESYWHGLLGADGLAPLRSQIDPRGIESALEYAFLGERIAPMLAKLRVSGTHLNELMGLDMAGMPLSTLITPEDREQLGAAVSKLFSEGLEIRLRLVAEEGFGKGRLTGDMLLLPLRSDLGDMSRMIGGLVTHGRLGRTPRRFRIESISMRKPGQAPIMPAPLPAPVAAREPLLGLAESQAPYRTIRTPKAPRETGKRPPYLRLIISNDD
ncbi:PAS domain-containing protein [Salipiger mangrovisoli]|uniref:PAS domain-containing protein n=1 Tax=Salipiger mangrovisoli TaxID=2865933 RepID=A0ABR9WXA1_9RHOB|nr:PAS domain-containing protein [Salipiger mangrovisoli]MBE9635861.1 PAS domain-containing protein [Salipiger mangrovisoli]